MPKMLRHTKTGDIYPYNPNMARHEDMEVVEEPDKQFVDAKEQAKADRVRAAATARDQADADVQKAPPKPKQKVKPKAKSQPKPPVEDTSFDDDDPLAGLDLDDE